EPTSCETHGSPNNLTFALRKKSSSPSTTHRCSPINKRVDCPCHPSLLNADLYFTGPRAAGAHLRTAGWHVRFLNFLRRRGYLRRHRRILRLGFATMSSIASMEKQKP